ncbi:hypothetical protein [Phosphitispora sp. TUW77]|uniref:hypothetical protein n=1 Tax=Phosphitispora sp. TUW77 TaxID=3152361 RepID=UPI003AB1E3C4
MKGKEKMNKSILETSDAWLLLAIIYASSNEPADLSKIIGAGDYINHAIFTLRELKGGIARLSNHEYIKDHGELKFSATDKILMPYNDFSKKKRRVSAELEFVRKTIGANVYKLGTNQLNENME